MADLAVAYKLGVNGENTARAALDRLNKNVSTLAKNVSGIDLRFLGTSLQNIGTIASSVFKDMTSGVANFVRNASPRVMSEFNASLSILSGSIGLAFIPLVRMATNAIMGLASWFYSLSSAQRDLIASVTIAGVAMIATLTTLLVIIPKLTAAFMLMLNSIVKHPIVAAVMLIVGALTWVLTRLKDINAEATALSEDVERITKKGIVYKEEVQASASTQRLLRIKNPQERAQAAQNAMNEAQQRKQAFEEEFNPKPSFGSVVTAIPRSIINGVKVLSGEYDRRKASVEKDLAMATKVRDLAKQGKTLTPVEKGMEQFGEYSKFFKPVTVSTEAQAHTRIQQANLEDPQEKLMRNSGLIQRDVAIIAEQIAKDKNIKELRHAPDVR